MVASEEAPAIRPLLGEILPGLAGDFSLQMRQNGLYFPMSCEVKGDLAGFAGRADSRYAPSPGDGKGVFYWPNPKGENGNVFHSFCRRVRAGDLV